MVDLHRKLRKPPVFRSAILLIAVAGLMLVGGTASADSSAAPSESVAALVEQLDDVDFERREAAVASLQTMGADAIDALVTAARKGSPEVASRSVHLLDHLMQSAESDVVDAADAALATLVASDNPQAASLADAALVRNSAVRQERAIAELTELGAQVQSGPAIDMLGQPIGIFRNGEQPDTKLVPRSILIPRDWKGGVDGLAQLRRLSHLSNLQVYVENGSQVPLAQVQSLASVLPGLIVHQRGAYLGVGTSSNAAECEIGEVKPGGPADKAGLQARDVVVAFDEHQILQFTDLVGVLQDYEPGTTAKVTVLRHGRTLELPVEVEAWHFAPVAEDPQDRLMLPPGNFPRPPFPAPVPPRP